MGKFTNKLRTIFALHQGGWFSEPKPEPVKPWTAAELAVAKGAGMLDLINPSWADWLDIEAIDQYDPSKCVLGQLYGFTDGIEKLEFNFGGSVYSAGFVESDNYTYEELNSAWKAAAYNRVY